MSLFRSEVLAQRFRAPLAEPLQLPSARLRGLAWMLLLGTLLGLVGLLQFSYATKVSVTGYTEPAGGVTRVFSSNPGVVTAVHVAEGDWVAAGASLMTVNLQAYLGPDQAIGDLQVTQLEHQLAELEHQHRLQAQQQGQAVARIQRAQQQQLALLPLVEIERSTQAQRLQLLGQRVAGLQQLNLQGVVPRLELAQAQAELLAVELVGAGLERQHLEITHRLDDLSARFAEQQTQLELDVSRWRRQELELQQQLVRAQAARRTQVLAPVAGQVSFLQAQVGKRVGPGQALLNLVDAEAKQSVVLLLPSRAAGQVERGQQVSWRYRGLSPQRSELMWGRVLQVSSTPVAPADLDLHFPLSEPAYRARLQLDPGSKPPAGLVPGLLVEADIRLQQARLWRWLLEPVLLAWQRL